MMEVTKIFTFDSAHFLPNYYGQCERVHGHTYTLHVTVEGDIGQNGLVLDFIVLKRVVQKTVISKIDHQLLNDFVPVPSCENVARWIWDQLFDLPTLLKAEAADPNLSDAVRFYFKENTSTAPLDHASFSNLLHLKEVMLSETPTSFVRYRGN